MTYTENLKLLTKISQVLRGAASDKFYITELNKKVYSKIF
jgi:hypothetical protein